MARTRYIKPDFFEDTKVSELSIAARLLYIGLWCFMDRQGITEDDPKLIRRRIFGGQETTEQVIEWVQELISAGRLSRVEWDGKFWLYCPKFSEHQKFHHAESPKYEIPQEVLLASCKPGASTIPTSVVSPASRSGNWNGELERVTGTGNAAPGPQGAGTALQASEPEVSECVEEWAETLKHFQIERGISERDQVEIARAIQRFGPNWVRLALQGARKQKANPRWDPKQFVSLRSYLHPDRIERLVNIGAGQESPEGVDWAKVFGKSGA